MLNVLHTADWHLGNFPGPEKNGVNLRAVDIGNCINHLQMVVMAQRPDVMVISGDLFHQARVWADRGLSEVKTAIRALEVLSDYLPVVVLRGTPNHDGTEQFAMLEEHFRGNDSVHIITDPKVLQVKGYKRGSEWVNVACLPGFDRGTYRAKFPGISKDDENLVFTEELGKITLALKGYCVPHEPSVFISHYTIPGCNTESGQTQFLAQFEPVITPEVLDAADFDLVAFGHIHRPQQLQSCRNAFYSGALNAMNFNDEGQERGFWIHTIDGGTLTKSKFYKTPHREFCTLRLANEDVEAFNSNSLEGRSSHWNDLENCGGIQDKIVRVLYSCTDANAKALNKSVLEQRLYADGAFWVSEISPEKISTSVNRNALDDKADPLSNLREYLEDKAYTNDDIAKAIEVGTPIIDAVLANTKTSRLTGIFEPVEIAVKNYRNYEEETFDFKNISFCTINGKNGAGKSSLFMDAILDCLYEEPREGDLTGWIRADEKARSGSISFTFKIGDKQFRVVRTRAKSGKATLNISELVGDEWVNRSAEKIRDTQDAIVDILGMDSLTFRSCALIMQDQYGLFLQADKESRVSILSNILGLGMYEEMQEKARLALTDTNREIALQSSRITMLTERTAGRMEVEEQIKTLTSNLASEQSQRADLAMLKDESNLELSGLRQAAERAERHRANVVALEEKKTLTVSQMAAQRKILEDAQCVLSNTDAIKRGVEIHNTLIEREKSLLEGKLTFDSKSRALAEVKSSVGSMREKYAALSVREATLERRAAELNAKLRSAPELEIAHGEWLKKKAEMDNLSEQQVLHAKMTADVSTAASELMRAELTYKQEYSDRVSRIKHLQSRMALLNETGCVDIENAQCKFLADAREAQGLYETLMSECKEWKAQKLEQIESLRQAQEQAQNALSELNFAPDELTKLRCEISALDVKAMEYLSIASVQEQANVNKETLDAVIGEMADMNLEIESATCRERTLNEEVLSCMQAAQLYESVRSNIADTAHWLEREKSLPVAQERKRTADKRLLELEDELFHLNCSVSSEQVAYDDEMKSVKCIGGVEEKLRAVERALTESLEKCELVQQQLGVATHKLDVIMQEVTQIGELSAMVADLAERAATLEILKMAFSPDGVPHNVIRSMLPLITATANNILGQMTGGRMGMEFRTEKVLKSNSKKEVVTLDIFIEEQGKPPLPYASKSGGEKVKSALSAILALAETKSTSAGIRLGMLFIDEPPFLDGDGIQAYCDALETIGQRYADLKIMAITHDPTMKARFPQNLDVIKTEQGSKVIFE